MYYKSGSSSAGLCSDLYRFCYSTLGIPVLYPDSAHYLGNATRFAPGPNTFQYIYFIFMTTLKRGSSQLSMSHQNISLLIFLQDLCPMIDTCPYAIKSWGGRQLHLLTTRECEVFVESSPKCLPTSVPILPILLRAILYLLQYMQSFPPIIHLS